MSFTWRDFLETTIEAQRGGKIKEFLIQKGMSISMKLHHAEGFKNLG